jgi:hypothetical protein
MGNGGGILQQIPQGDKMSSDQNRKESSLLWDCFTNWSQTLETLEKIGEQKDLAKKETTTK